LIIAALGLSLGHIGRDVASILALSLVLTATLSTYMMAANHALAQRVVRVLKQLGIPERAAAHPADGPDEQRPALVLLGFHRVASSLVYDTQGCGDGREQLVVDFNPVVHRQLLAMDIPVVYGDISHLDSLEHAGIERAEVVLSTVSEDFLRGTDNLTLIKQIRHLNPSARIIVSAETLDRARAMYDAGADYVVLPRVETARAFLNVLDAARRGALDDLKARALADLADRKETLA
jgi:voltage-gated potassium channel Kch